MASSFQTHREGQLQQLWLFSFFLFGLAPRVYVCVCCVCKKSFDLLTRHHQIWLFFWALSPTSQLEAAILLRFCMATTAVAKAGLLLPSISLVGYLLRLSRTTTLSGVFWLGANDRHRQPFYSCNTETPAHHHQHHHRSSWMSLSLSFLPLVLFFPGRRGVKEEKEREGGVRLARIDIGRPSIRFASFPHLWRHLNTRIGMVSGRKKLLSTRVDLGFLDDTNWISSPEEKE